MVALFIASTLLFTLAPLTWLALARHRSRRQWLARTLLASLIVAAGYLVVPWAFTSYYLRYAAILFLVVAAIFSYWRIAPAPASGRSLSVAYGVAVLAAVALTIGAIRGRQPPAELVSLAFPLRGGTYYVLQGGSNGVTNPFHALENPSRYALDLVRLTPTGNRAAGIAPPALGAYAIYGDAVYSPCSGSVLKVRSAMNDRSPVDPDAESPEGNFVVLRCREADVYLAHFQSQSLNVSVGQAIDAGEKLGRVGNSGYTLEPHLHISAIRAGRPIGLLFENRFLALNDVVVQHGR